MGNSGKTAIGAFAVAAGLLVLTAYTLEEAALFAFLAAVAVGYVASVAEAFARHRYLALLAGGAGTSLFIGCSIAFLRMWGLAFNQSPAALGQAVTTRDSDIYFYLAAASGCLTLLVLFCAAVWPSRRRRRQGEHTRSTRAAMPTGAARPRPPAGPARTAAPARAAGAPARPATRLPAGARQSAPAPVRQQQAQRPAQPKPPQQKPVQQKRPTQQKPVQRSDGRTARR
ncbi:hypothetical protein [Arthrobacter sp. NPDC057013]|uniref:hypothetical protein n=1 Tax=Arthrobacter sp. NPDC057013 TaxID=3345999 RepID=UPI00362BB277